MQQDNQQPADGYPCSMFLAPPDAKYMCGICMDVLRDPVQVCSNHHTYCRGCIAQSKSTSTKCPVCREEISREETTREKRDEILLLEVRCPHAISNGDSGGGGGSGGSSGTTDSPSSSSDVTADAEDGHQHKKRRQDDGAGPSSLPATSCGWTGPWQDYEAHVVVCPFVEVPCPFAEAGCAFRAARRDMSAHGSDMGAHFLASVKAECAALNSDINSLQRYVSILHTSGDAAAAGVVEWVSSRFIPETDEYEECTYTGQMRGGECDGFGRASYLIGDYESYDGQWKEDAWHGQGLLKGRNGNVYNGQWKDDKKHGQGIFMCSSGDIYVGQFEESKMHGQGVYKWISGDSEEGRYEEGKKQGLFIHTYADGTRSNRIYENNIMTSETPIV
jgi:hypothetical protein